MLASGEIHLAHCHCDLYRREGARRERERERKREREREREMYKKYNITIVLPT